MDENRITRRDCLMTACAGAGAAAVTLLSSVPTTSAQERIVKKGRINHSVCMWCFSKIPVEEMATHAARIGMAGIDLLTPESFPTLKKYNLQCTMTMSHGIAKGLNRKENWDECLGKIRKSIDANADAG